MDQRRVLLIESHPVLRRALHQLLCSTCHQAVDEAADVVDGVCLAVRLQPTLIILDTSVAELSGVTFSKLIRRLAPGNRVILLVDDAHDYDGLAEAYGTFSVSKRNVAQDLPPLLRHWLDEHPPLERC